MTRADMMWRSYSRAPLYLLTEQAEWAVSLAVSAQPYPKITARTSESGYHRRRKFPYTHQYTRISVAF